MPLYEYHCEKCGCTHEELAKADEAASPPCPRCGGASKKLMSPCKSPGLGHFPYPAKGFGGGGGGGGGCGSGGFK